MALLFASAYNGGDFAEAWRARFARLMPELDFRVWPEETGDPAEIEFALVWQPEPGLLASLPNLRAIFSLGMGVDHVFADPHLPAGVPIARMVDANLIERMSDYVLHSVLHYHREADRYDRDQRAGLWEPVAAPHASARRIGLAGLGAIGHDCARKLIMLGFDVAGWSRTPKSVEGVTSFHGADGFLPFLARTDYLVCLLPLTPETENILDARAFAAMPEGGGVINVARGAHVVDADLVAALDSGRLAFAKLDVFRTEPLPPGHPFWTHPKVRMTPHVAGITDPETAAAQVVRNIGRVRAGEPLLNPVDPARGY